MCWCQAMPLLECGSIQPEIHTCKHTHPRTGLSHLRRALLAPVGAASAAAGRCRCRHPPAGWPSIPPQWSRSAMLQRLPAGSRACERCCLHSGECLEAQTRGSRVPTAPPWVAAQNMIAECRPRHLASALPSMTAGCPAAAGQPPPPASRERHFIPSLPLSVARFMVLQSQQVSHRVQFSFKHWPVCMSAWQCAIASPRRKSQEAECRRQIGLLSWHSS